MRSTINISCYTLERNRNFFFIAIFDMLYTEKNETEKNDV